VLNVFLWLFFSLLHGITEGLIDADVAATDLDGGPGGHEAAGLEVLVEEAAVDAVKDEAEGLGDLGIGRRPIGGTSRVVPVVVRVVVALTQVDQRRQLLEK
jgi:hypothetical protein